MYKWDEVFTEDDKKYPSLIQNNGYMDCEFSCIGYITWRGKEYPVYLDDYGCQDFIVFKYKDEDGQVRTYDITVNNMAGYIDWDWELDRMINEYGDSEN